MKRISFLLSLVLCLTLLVSQQNIVAFAYENNTNIISVSGSGELTITPDKAVISLGVETFDEELSNANNINSDKVSQIISYLTENGIDKEDIHTTNYYASQQYQYTDAQKTLGYQVSNCINFCTSNLDNLNTLIEELIEQGANIFHGIHFDYSDKESTYNQALQLALDNATAKAQALSQGLPVEIQCIKEQYSFCTSNNTFLLRTNDIQPSFRPGNIKVTAYIQADFYVSSNTNTDEDLDIDNVDIESDSISTTLDKINYKELSSGNIEKSNNSNNQDNRL